MKYFMLLFICGFSVVNVGCSQPKTNYAKYLKSFKEGKQTNLYNFGEVLQTGAKMTREETLSFVYNNDTSRLFCYQKK